MTRILKTLQEVGLGYVTLGQPSPSLSGGEAQRVRLAREVTKAKTGDLVLLDEPTTGLHPGDLDRLLTVLDRLTANGCTVVVVEHQADVIAAADWRIELGPGGGPDGGRLQHCGPAVAEQRPRVTPRAKPRADRRSSDAIRVRGARAHNLQGVDVEFAKDRFTVVTGVSGSGKSSLVHDVVAAEADRRLLECLSVYERQSVREGPEAPVDSLTGLGPTMSIDAVRHDLRQRVGPACVWDAARTTVGRSSDLDRLISPRPGARRCADVPRLRRRPGSPVRRRRRKQRGSATTAATSAVPIEPRHLIGSPASDLSAVPGARRRAGVRLRQLIVQPDAPLVPAVFGGGLAWFGTDGGRRATTLMRTLAERYRFDPDTHAVVGAE